MKMLKMMQCPVCKGDTEYNCPLCDRTGMVPDMVECPCCHGQGHLVVHPANGDPVYHAACCHCGELGTIRMDSQSDYQVD